MHAELLIRHRTKRLWNSWERIRGFPAYFFLDKNPSTLLANSSENPNRAFARELRSTAFLSIQIIADFHQPSCGRAK